MSYYSLMIYSIFVFSLLGMSSVVCVTAGAEKSMLPSKYAITNCGNCAWASRDLMALYCPMGHSQKYFSPSVPISVQPANKVKGE